MASRRVALFCEDAGHELFCVPLLARLAEEQGVVAHVDTKSAVGGHGRAIAELQLYQRTLARGCLPQPVPDLLVVVIDGNDMGWRERRAEALEAIDTAVFPRHVVGCPDPQVERWCFADPEAFSNVVGIGAPPVRPHSDLKQLLADTIRKAGQFIVTDPMEFAPDIVRAMDLFRAGKHDPSLELFLSDLRAALLVLRDANGGAGREPRLS